MRKALFLLVAAALVAPAAYADDLIPPPWERVTTPGTTYAEWYTWAFPVGPTGGYLADEEYNPYGTPEIVDVGGFGEVVDYAGREDVLHITDGDWLEMMVPNNPEPNDYKDIYLQITWHWDGAPDIPDVWIPETGDTIEITDEIQLEDGWYYTRYHIHIEPNPDFEEIDIWPADAQGDLYIDQIVIDTICAPEPGAMMLLAAGFLFLRRR